ADVQVHVRQRHALRLAGVLEADVVEVDGAVLDLGDGVGRADEVALFIEHLDDALHGLHGHGDHHEHHRDRHQAHQDLETVGKDGGHLAHGDVHAAPRDDG